MTDLKKNNPKQWEIWLFNPDPVVGNEVGKKIRPGMIISCNSLNVGPSGLAIIIPITSKNKKIMSHVRLEEGEGGLESVSFVMCEQIRSISVLRLHKRLGKLEDLAKARRIQDWIIDLVWMEK